jgi:hypothetical protein
MLGGGLPGIGIVLHSSGGVLHIPTLHRVMYSALEDPLALKVYISVHQDSWNFFYFV